MPVKISGRYMLVDEYHSSDQRFAADTRYKAVDLSNGDVVSFTTKASHLNVKIPSTVELEAEVKLRPDKSGGFYFDLGKVEKLEAV
jgi:hypothetical protein